MLNMADSTCKIVSLRALDENIKSFFVIKPNFWTNENLFKSWSTKISIMLMQKFMIAKKNRAYSAINTKNSNIWSINFSCSEEKCNIFPAIIYFHRDKQ